MSELFNIREGFQRLNMSFRKLIPRFSSVEEADDYLGHKSIDDIPKQNASNHLSTDSTGQGMSHMDRLISYCRMPFSEQSFNDLDIRDNRLDSMESSDDIDECIAQFKLSQCNKTRTSSIDEWNTNDQSKSCRRVSKISIVTVLSNEVTFVRETTTTFVKSTCQSRSDLCTKYVSNSDRLAAQHRVTAADDAKGVLQNPTSTYNNIYEDAFFDTAPCLKISLQYFSSGNQLRVLLLKTRDLTIRGGSIISKCTLFKAAHKKRTRSLKGIPTSRKAKLNQEVVFDKIQVDSNSEWTLRIRLYFKRSFLSRKTCLGETTLSLSQLDLFMNTTFWCILNPKSASKQDGISQGSNFRVLYRDQTINAYAKASLSTTDLFSTTSSTSSLHLSRSNLRRIDTDPLSRKMCTQQSRETNWNPWTKQ